jgi:hypothetical protein
MRSGASRACGFVLAAAQRAVQRRKACKLSVEFAAAHLDRAAVVRALDALARRRARQKHGGAGSFKGAAMTGRTAAYGRVAFSWAD